MTRAKTDCFAYKPGQQKPPRRKAECTELDKLYCKEGECKFYKDRQDMEEDPNDEYEYTQNMSIKQQNEAEYPKYEYSDTYNASMAGKLIRAQGEQIRRMSAEEYLKDKIGSDADGQKSNLRLRGCEGAGTGDGGRHTE